MFERSDLPYEFGRTTNSFVEIKRSSNNTSYFKISDNVSVENIESLKDFVSFTSSNLTSGSDVELFYNNNDCPFLMKDMVLIDTPGIDANDQIDIKTLSYCRGADLIVLVVNSTRTISNHMRTFISQIINQFSNIRFILVYNHLDLIDDPNDLRSSNIQHREDSRNFFRDILHVQSNDASKERTFYLSAKEKLEKIYNSTNNSEQNSRSNEFEKFKKLLKNEMSVNPINRRIEYLNGLYEIVMKVINECETVVEETNNQIPIASRGFRETLNQISNLESEINTSISDILNPLCEEFCDSTLREIRRERDRRVQMERLRNSLQSVLNRSLNDIKSSIINIIRRENDEERLLIINNMYFPHYLASNFPIMYAGRSNETETIKLVAGTVLVTLAGFGLRGGIMLTIGAAAAAAGAVFLGPIVIAASAVLGAASLGYSGYKVYDIFHNKDKRMIKNMWDELLKMTQESYSTFVTDFEQKFQELFNVDGKRTNITRIRNEVTNLNNLRQIL